MAVNLYLIIASSVLAAVIFFCCILYVHFYSHTDETGLSSLWAKIEVVLSFTFATCAILLLPFDVANTTGTALGYAAVDMSMIWLVFLTAIAALLLFVIPFSIWFYESDTTNFLKRLCQSLCWQIIVSIICIIIIALMYIFLGTSDIPVSKLSSNLVAESTAVTAACSSCGQANIIVSINPTIVMYTIALLTFVGWILLVIFGGIGLSALPMDLINDFRTRPKDLKNTPAGKEKYMKMKNNLRERSEVLLSAGQKMKEQQDEMPASQKLKPKEQRKLNQWKAAVYLLDKDFDYFNFYNDNQRSPIWYWLRLFLGILLVGVSITWFIHIIIYVLIDYNPFLNDAFAALDSVFALFGVLFYALFVLYLLVAVLKGNMKFGLRLLICTIHPIKYRGTYMNSFLFNAMLIMLSMFPLMQFCAQAFASYAQLTVVDVIFNNQAKYLRFLTYFWATNAYIYALLGFAFITFFVLLFYKGVAKREQERSDEFERIREMKV